MHPLRRISRAVKEQASVTLYCNGENKRVPSRPSYLVPLLFSLSELIRVSRLSMPGDVETFGLLLPINSHPHHQVNDLEQDNAYHKGIYSDECRARITTYSFPGHADDGVGGSQIAGLTI